MINKYIYNSNYFNGLLSLYNKLGYTTPVLHTYIIFIETFFNTWSILYIKQIK